MIDLDDIMWFEKYDWGCTSTNHIWECVQTGLYHFSDETSMFDETGYETIQECQAALKLYCETYL